MKKSILIFIITYKASFRLQKVFNRIPFNQLKNFKIKILISDDGSFDNTIFFARKIKVNNNNVILNINKINKGYGGNIKFCLNYSISNNYDYAVMLHGDNQYDPNYIVKMIKKMNIKKYAAICGSRMINKNDALKGGMPLYKFFGNIILTNIFNFFFNTKFTDCHSGFWFYNLSVIKKINFDQNTNSFNFDNQLRIKLIKNYKIAEIAIKTYYGTERSSVHLFYALNFVIDLLKEIFLKKYFFKLK
jgi:GT2 family glycosyltransferase